MIASGGLRPCCSSASNPATDMSPKIPRLQLDLVDMQTQKGDCPLFSHLQNPTHTKAPLVAPAGLVCQVGPIRQSGGIRPGCAAGGTV